MAANAARLMASKAYDPVVKKANEDLKYCVLEVMNVIPREVIEVCQKYPNMFYSSNDVYMYWNGRDYHVQLPFCIPSNIRVLQHDIYPKECQELIIRACKKILDAESKRTVLRLSLETTIFNLKTRARLEVDFPEACEFIDWPIRKQVPAVPVPNELRKLFQK